MKLKPFREGGPNLLPKDKTPEEIQIANEFMKQDLENLEPVKLTPEERRAMKEAGEELGLSLARYLGTVDIVKFPKESVKEIMACLNDPRMPPDFTRRDRIHGVQYEDRPFVEVSEKNGRPKSILGRYDLKTNTAYIFQNKTGKCPSGKQLYGIIWHEVLHSSANEADIQWYANEHSEEVKEAVKSQLEEKGYPSEYAQRKESEFINECYRTYFEDPSKLSAKIIRLIENISQYFSGYSGNK